MQRCLFRHHLLRVTTCGGVTLVSHCLPSAWLLRTCAVAKGLLAAPFRMFFKATLRCLCGLLLATSCIILSCYYPQSPATMDAEIDNKWAGWKQKVFSHCPPTAATATTFSPATAAMNITPPSPEHLPVVAAAAKVSQPDTSRGSSSNSAAEIIPGRKRRETQQAQDVPGGHS